MKLATSIAIAALLMAGSAFAQTATAPKSGTTKMSQSDCTAAWNRLDTAKSGSVSQAQAQGIVTDFKAADTNHDGKLTQSEFMVACDKGLVTCRAQNCDPQGPIVIDAIETASASCRFKNRGRARCFAVCCGRLLPLSDQRRC